MADGKGDSLLDPVAAAAATAGAAGLANETVQEVQKARTEGPLTFRMLGFLGGLAMIVSNGLAIVERFMSFHFANALIAIYCVLFGILIAALEAPGPCGRLRLNAGIRYYCKFLEFTWGRGVLYFFCGTLQASNWNMLDWAVGCYMIFVGVTAMIVGIHTARQMRLLRFAVSDEATLKEIWHKHDADNSDSLDIKELTHFIKEAGVEMSRNEIAATFMKLDKDFDDKLTYEEFHSWWESSSEIQGGGCDVV